jgi:hypothetical protein
VLQAVFECRLGQHNAIAHEGDGAHSA